MNLYEIREQYANEPLDESTVDIDPIVQFENWFNEAIQAKVLEPNAMVLSTVDKDAKPHARTVLLKGVEGGNFIFFTNYDSHKAMEVKYNNHVCLNFLWLELARQVRIEGRVYKIEAEESDAYFYTRPRGSQIGAHVSHQSTVIQSRLELENKLNELNAHFEVNELKRPDNWGGYAVVPTCIEFWNGRPNRLHDRILYTQNHNEWLITRLAP